MLGRLQTGLAAPRRTAGGGSVRQDGKTKFLSVEDLKISLFVCRAMPKFEPVRRNPAETDELVEDKLWS